LRRIVVAHNTSYANGKGAIGLPEGSPVEGQVLNNALHHQGRRVPDSAGFPRLLQRGNVNCTILHCFRDAPALDFSPFGIPPVTWPPDRDLVADDYYGRRRGDLPTPGALEQEGPPIELRIKSRLDAGE